jgi:hypothetical protein
MSKDTFHDESERLRGRQDDSDRAATRRDRSTSSGASCFVGKVVSASGPVTLGYFKVRRQILTGTEVEGGTGTLADAPGSNSIALNLGIAVPPSGTYVLITSTDYRWAFRYDG